MRIVLDTKVLISALVFDSFSPSKILTLIRKGEIDLRLSPFILAEFEKVLKEKFRYTDAGAAEAKADVEAIAHIVIPKQRVNIIRSEGNDNRILECALEAKADVLVTGDKKHILPLQSFEDTEILGPVEFLHKYFPDI